MDIPEKLSLEQNYAFEQFKKGYNLFITGPGGTGKTKLIQHLIDYASQIKKKFQVCALTGCASVLLNCGARTIHSWSGIRVARGPKDQIVASISRNRKAMRNWKSTKILIVDEVSMMSQKMFEILDEVGKIARNSSAPFGGIQVIFTGDFFQLPPVGTAEEAETVKFCFETPLWKSVFKDVNHIQLTTMFRQKDPVYIEILSQIRQGKLDEKNIQILQKYVKRKYDTLENEGIIPTKLFPIRYKADCVNATMFDKIDEDEYHFEHSIKTDCKTQLDTGKALSMEQLIKCEKMTQMEREYETERLLRDTPCSPLLKLKKGASVICTVNIDMDNSICNGSQGIIVDIVDKGSTTVVVKFVNGITKQISPNYWQSEDYPSIAISQYPLSLAWALTIHKIQGATLQMAEIDIGLSVFEYGQTYVALSRIQSLDGLYLSAFQPERIRANPTVVEFYKNIPNIDYTEENREPTQEKTEIQESTKKSKEKRDPFAEFRYTQSPIENKTDIKVVKLS